jgi:metallo-beta-lactamase family protein
MKLTFWGAAQTVTGSMHMIEASGKRILLDCGLYQGRRKEAEERNRSLPFQASDIDSVVLSHAHIDHSGNLPTLTRHGFRGTIHSTPATADLCEAMLKDSAVVQERDAEFANRRHRHRRQQQLDDRNPEAVPLYTVEDAEITAGMFRDVRCHTHVPLAPDLGFRFHEAGHMLG